MNSHHAPLEGHSSTAHYRNAGTQDAYQHQDFPKLVYKGKTHKSVANSDEEKAAIEAGFSPKPPETEPEAV